MPSRRTLQDGLVVGLIAYASVAVFYGAFDLLASRGTLYTVDLLGKAVFRGLRDTAVLQFPVEPDLTSIFWYNGLHLLLSLAIGIVVTTLVDAAERDPSHSRLILSAIVGGFVVTVAFVSLATEEMRPLLPIWSIVFANAFASLLAGLYLLRRRPGLLKRMMPLAG
jgi:hypothetical protein